MKHRSYVLEIGVRLWRWPNLLYILLVLFVQNNQITIHNNKYSSRLSMKMLIQEFLTEWDS